MNALRSGRLAEGRALRLLLARGWTLQARNWRCRWGEMDLLMSKGDRLLLVEVKGRRRQGPDQWGLARFRRGQRRPLERAYGCWLQDHPHWSGATVELVVALVPLPPSRLPVRWLRMQAL
ncbi:YraN family protein [Synechococcus sp. RSCCF101]|uniref:YraN family protein n=1 Tax=Synechococcus sp. RSCCF101 TaxID=2511069 RepID=UPI001CD99E06|nr:YraN family protein [Synechococcus sp. RSCCF101]